MTWEQRMADKHRKPPPPPPPLPHDFGEPDWLNGNKPSGPESVLVNGSVYCVGCGDFLGTTAFVWLPGDEPLPEPDYPYTPDTCPSSKHRETVA